MTEKEIKLVKNKIKKLQLKVKEAEAKKKKEQYFIRYIEGIKEPFVV